MQKHPLASRRTVLVIAIYVLCLLWGVNAGIGIGPQTQPLYGFVFAIIMAMFCITDAHVRGKPLLRAYHWVILAIIGPMMVYYAGYIAVVLLGGGDPSV